MQDELVAGPEEIDRHGPHPELALASLGQELLGEPVEVTERVETGYHHNHLQDSMCVEPVGPTGPRGRRWVVTTPSRVRLRF